MSTFGRATHVPPVRGCCIVFASARPVLAAEFHGVLKTALAGSVAVMKPSKQSAECAQTLLNNRLRANVNV